VKLLTEQVPYYTRMEVLTEDAKSLPKGVIMRAKGKLAHAGKVTANGRLYRVPLMQREIERVMRQGGEIEERAMIGETDHPNAERGGPSVRQSAFIVTGLGMNADGEVMGEIEVVGTEAGKDLAALIRAGAQVGFSSRARGSATTKRMTSQDPDYERNRDWDGREFEEVNDDFRLVTFDSVIGPAVSDAHVSDYNEQKEDVMEIKLEDVLKNEELLKQVLESEPAKKRVEDAVKDALAKQEEKFAGEVKEMVREYLGSEEFMSQFEVEEGENQNEGDEELKCAECGTPLLAEGKFCPGCGIPISRALPEKNEGKRDPDEKDKEIEELRKRVEQIEKVAKEKDEKIAALESREEERKLAAEVDRAVAEALEGQPVVIADHVRADIDELRERDKGLDADAAKEFVEARIKKYRGVVEAVGGDLTEAAGFARVNPSDRQRDAGGDDELTHLLDAYD